MSIEPPEQNNSSDMLSNLPDLIISHILSFLPTVDAVATCVLSTKWINHWTNISNLTFDDAQPPFLSNNSKFVSFVNRVLHFHRPLSKFSLNCRSNSELYDISTWISISIMKGVREIHVSIMDGDLPFQLPRCIFSSVTLEVLKLKGGRIMMKVPNVVHLPNLKTMELNALDDDDVESACKLISRCKSLEQLYLTHMFFEPTFSLPNLKVLNLKFVYFGTDDYTCDLLSTFPSVESLVIIDPNCINNFTISSSSLKSLKVELPHIYGSLDTRLGLVLDTPALQDLDLDSFISMDVQVKDLSSLISSSICLDYCNTFNNISYYNATGLLFHGLCNVRILFLSWRGMRDAIADHKFPEFPRLAELSVDAGCYACPLVEGFIKNSKVLEKLILVFNQDDSEDTNSEAFQDDSEDTDSEQGDSEDTDSEQGDSEDTDCEQGDSEDIDCEPFQYNCEDADCEHIPSWNDHEIAPDCLSSSFRTLHLYGFQGLENELALVEYLLKNGRVMRNMEIEISHSLDSDIRMNLHQKLLKFPKGSEECEITLR